MMNYEPKGDVVMISATVAAWFPSKPYILQKRCIYSVNLRETRVTPGVDKSGIDSETIMR